MVVIFVRIASYLSMVLVKIVNKIAIIAFLLHNVNNVNMAILSFQEIVLNVYQLVVDVHPPILQNVKNASWVYILKMIFV